MTGCDPTLLNA